MNINILLKKIPDDIYIKIYKYLFEYCLFQIKNMKIFSDCIFFLNHLIIIILMDGKL